MVPNLSMHPGESRQVKTYLVGIAAMGMVIGLLAGASASPIVGVLLPLIFALITAGGNLYLVWGEKTAEQDLTKRHRSERAYFLGAQMVAFASTFLLGLWVGVFVKFHSGSVWLVAEGTPAYLAFADSSPPVVRYLRFMDVTMSRDGAPFDQRQRILKSLVDKQEQWKDEVEDVLGEAQTKSIGGYSPELDQRWPAIPGSQQPE